MAKEKVREAIDDLARRGLANLDPLIALMHRGPAAMAELAIAAEHRPLRDVLTAAVRAQAVRFAAVVASLPRSVRQHSLTVELLSVCDTLSLARASLLAGDQGRADESAFLAGLAADREDKPPELLIVLARLAAAAGDGAQSAELYGQAIASPVPAELLVEAGEALFAAGRTTEALQALAKAGPTAREALVNLAVRACLHGETELIAAWLTTAQAESGDASDLLAVVSTELGRSGSSKLRDLASPIEDLRAACQSVLAAAGVVLLDAAAMPQLIAEARAAILLTEACASRASLPDAPGGALASGDVIVADLAASGQRAVMIVSPAVHALKGIAGKLKDIGGAGGTDQTERGRGAASLAREALTGCDQLLVYIDVANRRPDLRRELPLPILEAAAARLRPSLANRRQTVVIRCADCPPVLADRQQLELAVHALTAAMARRSTPGAELTLALAPESSGTVRLSIATDTKADLTSEPLAVGLAEQVAAAHAGHFAIADEPQSFRVAWALAAETKPAIAAELDSLAADARMALRAATGLADSGDSGTACFLIDKGVTFEAARRLRPYLARHFLLPRAVWLLSAENLNARAAGEISPKLAARRVEEYCRAVVNDRLDRRMTNVRSYSALLTVFCLPHRGWPSPADLPSLSVAEISTFVTALGDLADLIERRQATAALASVQTVVAFLQQVRLS